MRYFNTTGPCVPELHYMLPAAPRLPDARRRIETGRYFVVHAPRQTGKTTTLRALAQQLTAEGRYAVLHFSCETGEPAGDNYGAAEELVLGAIREAANEYLPADLQPPDPWPDAVAGRRLRAALGQWAEACPRPLVLFLDEIDALRGESLRSALRQLRDGFPSRPTTFPHSVAVCGLRDVRDYKAAAGGDPDRLGTASPFNIKVKSYRLGDFTEDDVRDLYGQHATETGQDFTDEAIERAWQYTAGQPWLVNAVAAEVTDEMLVPLDEPITAAHIETAKERLILARATHLDSLLARLYEPRVQKIIQTLIAGDLFAPDLTFNDDLSYVRDLGLIAQELPVRVANPIYREVIVRALGTTAQANITADPHSFIAPDGRLDFDRLLREFTSFWKANAEILTSQGVYHEVAPQLVIMAYFQRLLNGGGQIEREYGVGRGRVDLFIRWPYQGADGEHAVQYEAVELKLWHPKRGDPLEEGLAQLDDYLGQLGLDAGTLVIFDRRPSAPPLEARISFDTAQTPSGRAVTVLRA